MPMYRTKPIEARCLDFDHPNQVADIEDWCGGKLFGRKLMVDVEGAGSMAHPGDYVAKTAKGEFIVLGAATLDALFEQVAPRA